MSSSESSSKSSSVDENGILDDVLGNNNGGNSTDDRPPRRQSVRTQQKRRDSYGGRNSITLPSIGSIKKLKLSNITTDDSYNLIGKRLYPTASSPLIQQSNDDDVVVTQQPKTELEKKVLSDCLSNHFLLTGRSDSTNRRSSYIYTVTPGEKEEKDCDADGGSLVMVETLVNRFERVNFRRNEIVFEEGDPANYLYVLYRGDVLTRTRNEGTGTAVSPDSKDNGDDDDNKEDENEKEEGGDDKYTILGELELLTNLKYYKKTTKATSQSCTLFRLSANDFRSYFLPQHQQLLSPSHQQTLEVQEQLEEERLMGLLRNTLPAELSSYFFPDDDEDNDYHIQLWKRLLSERKVRNFRKGDILIHKTKPLHALVMVTDGLVVSSNNTAGGVSYEELRIGQGEARTSFGWQSVLKMTNTSNATERTMTGTIRAETDGQAFIFSKQLFESVFCNLYYSNHDDHQHNHRGGQSLLLDVQQLSHLRWKRTQMQQIMVFKDSILDSTHIDGLLDIMHHCEYTKDETIFKAGEKVEAAMYFVREGSVRLKLNKGGGIQIIENGGYFGEKNMLLDQNTSGHKNHYIPSTMTAFSSSASTKIDVLLLEECRRVVNTTILGLGRNAAVNTIDDTVQWSSLKRHKLIGQGSFGQVWLASIRKSTETGIDGEDTTNRTKGRAVALKVQAKYPLVQAGAAERLVAERNIMASLNSPFIIRLFNSFQDDYRLYMVTSLLPGGELESILPERGLSENSAKFYAAGILEAITYLHRKHIIHRDVKTDNVLLNDKGYPVLIDMGFGKIHPHEQLITTFLLSRVTIYSNCYFFLFLFSVSFNHTAKYVPDKTYTFCGSPMFMAPETILHKGQSKGVDHWSFAVVCYKMITGKYPFYRIGMDELALYKVICKGIFEITGSMSIEFRMLMIAMLYPDPSKRLGSRANGWRDIFDAPWFTSLDLRKLRKQTMPAPWVPSSGDTDDSSDHFIHQSSSGLEDFFDNDVCGKISNDRQEIFSSFGPNVSSPIGDPINY